MANSTFVSPYGPSTDSLIRVQGWISPEDKNYLRSIVPYHGFENYLIGYVYQQLVRFCKDSNLNIYDPSNIDAIKSAVDRINAVDNSSGPRPLNPISGRASTSNPGTQNTADVSSNICEDTRGRPGDSGHSTSSRRDKIKASFSKTKRGSSTSS